MPGYSSMIHALLLLGLLTLAAAQAPPFCGSGQGYSAGSTYQTNLRDLLRTLRGNASSSPSRFASGDNGAPPDTAWALVLCRGDVSDSDCYDCVNTASRDAERVCNRSRDVGLFYNDCYVRLANQDFLDPTGNSGEVHGSDGPHITSDDLEQAVTALLSATVQYAVDNSSRLFATGHWVGPNPATQNIYSAAQCAADLSPLQCRSCLQGVLGRWWTTFRQSGQSARIAGPRCTLRSQLTPFYNGSAMVLLPTTTTKPATRGSRRVAIVIGIVVALVVVASLAACWIWCGSCSSGKRHKTQVFGFVEPTGQQSQVIPDTSTATTIPSSARTENKSGQQGNSEEDIPRHFPYEKLVQATANFAKEKKLGQGAFGAVYEGTLGGIDRSVAIKKILETSSDQMKKAFDNEIKIMSRLHHRNILSLKGWCKEGQHLLLIYELMENRSLEDHLYPKNGTMDMAVYGEKENDTRPSSLLSWLARSNILIGIATGLAYLHKECQDYAIVHRDLKPANVMLDRELNAKLADFGLVTQVRHTQTSRPTDIVIGTPSYIDPTYRQTGNVCWQSDVYSLGVLLFEIVCGEKPIILQDGNKNSLIEKVRECERNHRILDAAEIGLRGQYDKQIEAVLRLGLECVLPDRHNRPNAGRVRERLRHMLENGKGLAASSSEPSEEVFGTCTTTFPMNSLDGEEADVSPLLSGEKNIKKKAS